MNMSPCMRCTRVDDPMQCENKACKVWQQWFIGRWENMRRQARVAMEQVKTQRSGVCIGGVYYSPPHRVTSYLESDPCEACLCPKDVCAAPCPRKRSWLQAKEMV